MAPTPDTTTVDTGELTLYLRAWGEGPPLLLLSGGPGGSPDELLPVAERLAPICRVHLLEQRATGRSRLPAIDASTITLDAYVRDVEAVRAHLGIEAWMLLGHSAGGGVAMAAAASHPARVSGLILVESSGIDLSFVEQAPRNLRNTPEEQVEMGEWMHRMEADPEGAALALHRLWLAGALYDRAQVDEVAGYFVREPDMFTVAELLMQNLMATGFDLKGPLARFASPTLIVHGRQGYMGPAVAERIHRVLPNSELVLLDECGHYPMFEQPSRFYEAVRRYVASHHR